MIDIGDLEVVDAHCHPFLQETRIDANQLVSSVTFGLLNPGFLISPEILKKYQESSGLERREIDQKYRITAISESMMKHCQNYHLYKSMIRNLSRFLNCGEDPADIVASRNAKSTEYGGYLTKLFGDANIDTLVVDDGYSELPVEAPLPHVELDHFMKYVPAKVARVTRIEPLLQESIDTCNQFQEFISLLTERLQDAVRKKGAVAFKSLIAYRSGLNISDPTESQAKEDFKRYKENKEMRIKALRDYVLRRVLEDCIDLDVPLQIHSGFGDLDIILEECNPLHLFRLLKDKQLRHAKVVLVHGGYPYTVESAYLTNALPNVFLDISVLIPYAGANMSNRILEVLELAPASKIMYASDATHIPELHWLSAKTGKTALQHALDEMIKNHSMTESEADRMARMILADNARTVFGIQ